jgi:hypothetical protein
VIVLCLGSTLFFYPGLLLFVASSAGGRTFHHVLRLQGFDQYHGGIAGTVVRAVNKASLQDRSVFDW